MHACDDEGATGPAHIYITNPEYHLLVDDDCTSVKKGLKKYRVCPLVDVVFCLVVYTRRSGAAGVILSGARR